MKIGILGTRGIPNHYGGFEKLAERLSESLAARGHEVMVYSSHNHAFRGSEWKGVKVIRCYDPEFAIGSAGQFLYDLNCIVDARKRRPDVVLNLGYTSSSVWMRLFPRSAAVVTNMDGLEWMRSKYSAPVRRFLRYAERLAVQGSDELVSDSTFIQSYLTSKYGREPRFIAYGADLFDAPDERVPGRFGLKPFSYNMIVARLEPENNTGLLLGAIAGSDDQRPVLVVGNKNSRFGQELVGKYSGDPRMIFTGAIYEAATINNLRYYSNLYFHGHSVGGTNPSLLEAMGCRCCIIAHDNGFNRAVLGGDADYFSDVAGFRQLLKATDRFSGLSASRVEANFEKVRSLYSWPRITDLYEQLMRQAVERKRLRIARSAGVSPK